MRRFTDSRGLTWDVVVGRESFGALYAIFTPVGENPGVVRQAPLPGDSAGEAARELDELTDEELSDLLERSEMKRLA